MKISNLIISGFAVVIAIMMTVSGISIFGTNSSSKGFSEYRGLARDTNLSGRLQANMLMVRMNVKDFLITNSEKDKQQYNDYVKKMYSFLKEAKVEIQKPERAKMIAFVDKEVQMYQTAFTQVEKAILERNALLDELRVLGLDMRKSLTEIMKTAYRDNDPDAAYYAGRIQEHLMLARYYVLAFKSDGKKETADRIRQELGPEIDVLLNPLDKGLQNPKRRALMASFIANHKKYSEVFEQMEQRVYTRNEIVHNTLDVIGPDIAKAVEDVKLSVKADQDSLGPELQRKNHIISNSVMGASVVGLIIAILFAFFIRKRVMKPLGGEPAEMGKLAEHIAEGRLDIDVDNDNASGLYASMVKMVTNLTDIAKSIRGSSESVASGSFELSSASEELSATVGDQTSQINSIASAMEEMAASSVEVLESLNMIIEKSTGAKEKADEGKSRLSQTNDSIESIKTSSGDLAKTISNLTNSSNEISEILNVINDIADQTNLLALNAAIEAARAGEAGRGFAVVADEVRKLAERTQNAIQEVESIIGALQSEAGVASNNMQRTEKEVESGVESLEATVSVFNSIVDAIEDVAMANDLINASVTEQNTAIENVNDSIQSVSSGLEQSASTVNEITKTIDELSQQADDMNTTVSALKTK